MTFFHPKAYRSFLFLLGFVPQEYGITPSNLATFESRMAPYLAQGFRIWQPTFFQYRDTDPVPYALTLGIQANVPIHLWQLRNSSHLNRVHWLSRRWIELQHVSEVPSSKRLAVTLASYHHLVQQTYGLTESAALGERQRQPGMPPTPAEIARIKLDKAKSAIDALDDPDAFSTED